MINNNSEIALIFQEVKYYNKKKSRDRTHEKRSVFMQISICVKNNSNLLNLNSTTTTKI